MKDKHLWETVDFFMSLFDEINTDELILLALARILRVVDYENPRSQALALTLEKRVKDE